MYNTLVIPVFIPHRGCPHDCLFCNQHSISGYKENDHNPVVAAIDEWLPRKRGRRRVQVAFFGGSFTCLPIGEQIALLSTVKPYLEDKNVDSIRVSTRPDCINPTTLDLLKAYKVAVVELGVQSLNDEVLQKARRGHTARQSREAFRLLRKAKLQVGIQLMLGLPGETNASFLRGIDEVIDLRPDFIRIYPTLVIKDSDLERLYRSGQYLPFSLDRAVAVVARSYAKLDNAGIEVVRMGLQPSESLVASLVAGPYHPAFGELVRSRLWLKKIRAILAQLRPSARLIIYVSHRDISAVIGMKKRNIRRLEELGFGGRFVISPDTNMKRGCTRYAVY